MNKNNISCLLIFILLLVFVTGCVPEEVSVNETKVVKSSPLLKADQELLKKYDDGLDSALEELDSLEK